MLLHLWYLHLYYYLIHYQYKLIPLICTLDFLPIISVCLYRVHSFFKLNLIQTENPYSIKSTFLFVRHDFSTTSTLSRYLHNPIFFTSSCFERVTSRCNCYGYRIRFSTVHYKCNTLTHLHDYIHSCIQWHALTYQKNMNIYLYKPNGMHSCSILSTSTHNNICAHDLISVHTSDHSCQCKDNITVDATAATVTSTTTTTSNYSYDVDYYYYYWLYCCCGDYYFYNGTTTLLLLSLPYNAAASNLIQPCTLRITPTHCINALLVPSSAVQNSIHTQGSLPLLLPMQGKVR